MKKTPRLLTGIFWLCLISPSIGQRPVENIADVFADPALDLKRPADRAKAAQRIRAIENAGLERARDKANAMGIPMRQERPDGTVRQIIDLDENGEFVINSTFNVNAAISTSTNFVQSAPYNLDGTGWIVGVWDGGDVRASHQEFGGNRVTVFNNVGLSSHATHVAGTIAALGVNSSAKGMATNARIDSYFFSSIISELNSRVATAPGQAANKHYVSNHSYGNVVGWDGNTWRGTGTNQNAVASQFGQYNGGARDYDVVIYNAPYHLLVKSAGNDNSNNPNTGATVFIGGVQQTYNPAIHPPGDGLYRNTTNNPANGYENIPTSGNAKNILTVGAANDAVTNGLRDPSKSTLTGFSSRGPTDDGRIKPDIVANGVSLTSSTSASNTSYGNSSGTSMSGPNVAGSAILLVQLYSNLFAGDAMRASTLKGLIIHTATDLGNPGPDYHYGWGLMDTQKAADLIIDHHANPTKNRMIEDQVTNSVTHKTHSFDWDGSSPIRATLCWTDPAGSATSAHDSRVSRLVNDLDLKLIAPDGSEHFPFVMPFVGTWTVESMSENATTGVNSTDNVEQVFIENPGQAGEWQALVTYKNTLTSNGHQHYSLLLSGSAGDPDALVLGSISPDNSDRDTIVSVDITGANLGLDTVVKLEKAGQPDIILTSLEMIGDNLRGVFDLTGADSGVRNLVATNPDSQTATIPSAFTINPILATIWSEGFDQASPPALPPGWSSSDDGPSGSGQWNIVSNNSHSPTNSAFIENYSFVTTTHLTSPAIEIPANTGELQLGFWHFYHLENTYDGGRIEFSLDGGDWFGIESQNSGASFAQNGYTHTISSQFGNSFGGLQAWSGNSGGFIQTLVDFTDEEKYAGKSLRIRWTLGTDTSVAAPGWYVDSITIIGENNQPEGGFITVTPAGNLNSTGPAGGPFPPFAHGYLIRNNGTEPVDWAATANVTWISLSSSGGTLAPGDSIPITASLNANANLLQFGKYNSSITFSNERDVQPDIVREAIIEVGSPRATGGTITIVGDDYIHTFGSEGAGTFEVIDGKTLEVDVLVVGGGGGGGSSTEFSTAGAGGGGAGGLVYEEGMQITGSLDLVVGSPGAAAGSGNTPGSNGGNSQFGPLIALGGGGGSGGNMQGLPGGSGGGSRGNPNGGPGHQPGSTSGGFGNAGGGWPSAGGDGAGGGGGAGEAAPSAPPQIRTVGGPGGAGRAYDIRGTLTHYAGGGGGGGSTTSAFGPGGQGGGGNGGNNGSAPTAGAPNTGGGGGGGNNNRVGANGGSGIIIVRYPAPSTIPSVTPYADWTAGSFANPFLDPTPTTDFDGGGLANALEWVLGGDPTDPTDDATIIPTLDHQSDPEFIVFTYRRTAASAADENTAIAVEYGNDLDGWTIAQNDEYNVIITVEPEAVAPGIDYVHVRIRRTLATTGKLFTRLRVEVTTENP